MKHTQLASDQAKPQAAALWALLRARSAKHDFFYGVKTTGVFCRLNCHSRIPKRENVIFFNSPAEALAAGFRACKRCQPEQSFPQADLKERLARACRLLEEAEKRLPLEAVACSVGMSPFHFHRQFKACLGVTPKQYQTSHRMDRFREELQRRGSVTEALYEAGFHSSSRAYEQVSRKLGMSPRQYQKGGDGVGIDFAVERASLGYVLVAWTAKGVCAIQLGDAPAELRRQLAGTFPQATIRENQALAHRYLRPILDYVDCPGGGLALPLDMRGTVFQRRVWAALQKIGVGQTVSYQELAKLIGSPRAVRAVASACAANELALVIPCHRVIRSDGSLGGYRWGLARKRALLETERRANTLVGSSSQNGVETTKYTKHTAWQSRKPETRNPKS